MWNDINIKVPEYFTGIKRFMCKVRCGSISTEIVEMALIGKHYPTGFRFSTSDWEYVTHWKEFNQ
jgi:hypothetical protein